MQKRNCAITLLLIAALGLAVPAFAENPLEPALQAQPSFDGLISWWLVSPLQKENLQTAKAPIGARENEEVAGAKGKWQLLIAPAFPVRFIDLRPFSGGSGTVWASVRVNSLTGGKRRVRLGSYCALKLFVDGKPALSKDQPMALRSDEQDGEIDLPKGLSELTVGVSPRSGSAGFFVFLTEGVGAGGKPMAAAGDRLVVPTVAGKPADSAAAFTQALTFISREMFVNPGQQVTFLAGMTGSVPTDLGPLSAQLVGADGKVIKTDFPSRTASELERQLWQAQYKMPETIGVAHELVLEVKAGEKPLGKKKVALYSLKGLETAAGTLEQEIAARSTRSGKAMPNAMLAAEKLLLFLRKIQGGEVQISAELGETLLSLLNSAKAFADIEEKGEDPLRAKTGYFERAYISAIDQAAQPYFVNVPAAFTEKPKERFPLVVFMHGYVPSYDKHKWWDEMSEFNSAVERNGAFLAIPFGRSNTDFQSSGEVDVMDVIAEMKRLYPIDDDRVYIYGYSMGGMAVYTLAAHYPDTFAAGIVLAGRADSPLQNHRPLTHFHPYKQWLIHADNPISLCENLVNVPLRIYHGQDDPIINVSEARRMEARLKEVGCDAVLRTMPGDHFFGLDLMGTDEPLQWLLQQKRKPDAARQYIKAYSMRHAKRSSIAARIAPVPPAPMEIEWTKENAFVKGKDLVATAPFVAEPKSPAKTPLLCGPVRDATCSPFVIVYGTSGNIDANARNRQNAERFAAEWYAFGRSRAIIKTDKELTDADKKKNLFLFGEEQENSVHAALASALPFKVKDGKVTIGEKTLPLQNRGLIYVYPSPGGNYVVISAGAPYGEKIGANHKLDLVPDFLLYESDQFDTDTTSTNKAVCAGFFDPQWKLDPKLTWWFEK